MILDCQFQVRVGFAGAIGFDFPAVLAMARLRGLDELAVAQILPYADTGLRQGLARLQSEKR